MKQDEKERKREISGKINRYREAIKRKQRKWKVEKRYREREGKKAVGTEERV